MYQFICFTTQICNLILTDKNTIEDYPHFRDDPGDFIYKKRLTRYAALALKKIVGAVL